MKWYKHGLERLIEIFTPQEVYEVIKNFDFIKIQNNGSKAYIKKIGGKYAIIIASEIDDKVITGINNLDFQALKNLGENYRWIL